MYENENDGSQSPNDNTQQEQDQEQEQRFASSIPPVQFDYIWSRCAHAGHKW